MDRSVTRDDTASSEAGDEWSRRSFVQLAAAGPASLVASQDGSGQVAEGYGSGEYGKQPFGGIGEETLSVETLAPRSVAETSVTLAGAIRSLGGGWFVTGDFEYRARGASSWTSSLGQIYTSTGTFSETITGLEAGRTYEFRARVIAFNGRTDTGGTRSVTPGIGPAIDQFLVFGTASGTEPVSVDWAVSGASGDLDRVELVVQEPNSGDVLATAMREVTGRSASDVTDLQVEGADSSFVTVRLTVTDEHGKSASRQDTVSV